MTGDTRAQGRWRELWNLAVLETAPAAVPWARRLVRLMLLERGMEAYSDGASVLVTELVTNAVKASAGAAQGHVVRLWLVLGSSEVLIVVWDAIPQAPVLGQADDSAERGRGLMLVEAISQRWGWRAATGGGKFVWAVLGGTDSAGTTLSRSAGGAADSGQGPDLGYRFEQLWMASDPERKIGM